MKEEERNKSLLEKIKYLKQEHHFWRYRRVWSDLKREGLNINKKRIYLLMNDDLLVTKETKRKEQDFLINLSLNNNTQSNMDY